MSTQADRPAARKAASGFSRLLRVDDVSDEGLAMTIEADSGECAAVADEIGLPAIGALAARLQITRLRGDLLRVEGTLHARITQICVVSLEPFESDVAQPVDITFAHVEGPAPERLVRQGRGRDASRREAEMHRMPPPPSDDGDADPPDPIVDGRIDLGVVAVEFLALALDFYPKKPGVHFSDVEIGDTNEPKGSAFAALERFKDRS